MSEHSKPEIICPLPLSQYPRIVMAHGGGGRLMQQLLERLIQPAFDNPYLAARHDSAVVELEGTRLAFTTDSYVVQPLFFPGGDIGKLAVCGTLNDLAMAGAKPLFLSAGLIIEEGFPMESLQRIVQSMQEAARAADALIVTGDTKVVDKGKGDGLYINTAGIGLIDHHLVIQPDRVQAGDAILLSGDIGRHGIAIMSEREGLAFESTVESDCADLSPLVRALLANGIELHCLRDLTRGGLASALIEIAAAGKIEINIEEKAVPVLDEVRGACEILGFDPLYVANEGCFIAFVPENQADEALNLMKQHTLGHQACLIGRAQKNPSGQVILQSLLGIRRVLEMLSGEQLPRIC